jgi:ATP-dependent RNA helicase RhlE
LNKLSSFAELGASKPVVGALARRNITIAFPIQELVLRDALAGRDVLAKSRTGSGKTLVFGVALVDQIDPSANRPAGLVLVPTRELAVQVTEEIRDIAAARNLRVAPVYGGVSIDKQAVRARKAHIVVATPGRLTDLVNRRLLNLDAIRMLVLDEADRMLDMGFQPQVDRIVNLLSGKRQTMFFSATLEGVVGNVARAYTHDPIRHEVKENNPTVDEAEHRFIPVEDHLRLEKLVELLKDKRDLALVFVRTKRGADRLATKLKAKGVQALAMHGDMTQVARERALARFTNGKVDVLVATDVAARGLDLDDITHVINYDPPQGHRDYLHRVGRTARAGRAGSGVTFVAPKQLQEISGIARQLKLDDEFEAEGLKLSTPQTVFSSHGRRSKMRAPRRRRF